MVRNIDIILTGIVVLTIYLLVYGIYDTRGEAFEIDSEEIPMLVELIEIDSTLIIMFGTDRDGNGELDLTEVTMKDIVTTENGHR